MHFPLVARAKLEHLVPPIPIFISDHSSPPTHFPSLSHCTQNNKSLSNDDILSLPPSPPRLPVIGNLHQVRRLPYRSFQALSNKYGPLMLLHLGHRPTLSSVDLVKEITKNHDIIFSNQPKATASDVLFYEGVFSFIWRVLETSSETICSSPPEPRASAIVSIGSRTRSYREA